MIVLVAATAIWIAGALTGIARQARLLMLGLLLTATLALHVALRDGHPLREATGGDAGQWLVLTGFVGLAWGYGRILGRVRRAAEARRPPAPPPAGTAAATGPLAPEELRRYARHLTLREIGGPGQGRLRAARVLVVGAGGLGAPAILYLAGSGVGTLGLIDPDAVELSNLGRQIIHGTGDLGRPKVQSAADAVATLNPHVRVLTYARALTAENAADLFAEYDLILDGTDGWETRALSNRAAVAAGVPLIAGALSQWEGQVGLWHPAGGGPCLACVFPEAPAPGLAPTCAEAGVAGPLPGVVGSLMALEAVKHLSGAGRTLRGRLLLWDGLEAEARVVEVPPRPGCPVCGGRGAGAGGA
ncbi:ThiF family adenylyltransferase [Rubellimicrobium sp. CFH 75288]|uniref:HesA/MoeB/ThiF family protein n=1 Tax=Rubellimicrobium sp. CFH 75288 TaxID=2697034 RepID=UPI00352B993D